MPRYTDQRPDDPRQAISGHAAHAGAGASRLAFALGRLVEAGAHGHLNHCEELLIDIERTLQDTAEAVTRAKHNLQHAKRAARVALQNDTV